MLGWGAILTVTAVIQERRGKKQICPFFYNFKIVELLDFKINMIKQNVLQM